MLSKPQKFALSIMNRGGIAKQQRGQIVYVNNQRVGMLSTMLALQKRGLITQKSIGEWVTNNRGLQLSRKFG